VPACWLFFAALWCRALPERLQRHTRRLTAWLRAFVLVMGAGIGIGLWLLLADLYRSAVADPLPVRRS
jgi:hypothetical protein